jgi:hypothetical protein
MAAVDLPPDQELLAQHNWPSLLPEQVNILRRGPGNGRLRSAGKSGAESDNGGRKQQTKKRESTVTNPFPAPMIDEN